MRRVNLIICAEVIACKEDKIISTLMRVSDTNPSRFCDRSGIISLKYHYIAEIFYGDKLIRSVMNQHPQTYYFGSFTSIDELNENQNKKYNYLLMKIGSHEEVTGIVTNSQGIKSMVQKNDIVIEPKMEKDKIKVIHI